VLPTWQDRLPASLLVCPATTASIDVAWLGCHVVLSAGLAAEIMTVISAFARTTPEAMARLATAPSGSDPST
jgi:hypothetical protein